MPNQFIHATLDYLAEQAYFFKSFFRNIFKKGFEWEELFR